MLFDGFQMIQMACRTLIEIQRDEFYQSILTRRDRYIYVFINGSGQHKPFIIICVLTDNVNPAGGSYDLWVVLIDLLMANAYFLSIRHVSNFYNAQHSPLAVFVRQAQESYLFERRP